MPPRKIEVLLLGNDKLSDKLDRVVRKLRSFSKESQEAKIRQLELARQVDGGTHQLSRHEQVLQKARSSTDRLRQSVERLYFWRKKENAELEKIKRGLRDLDILQTRIGRKYLLQGGRRGLLGGFSGFVILSLTGLLSTISAAAVALSASLGAGVSAVGALSAALGGLVPILGAAVFGFGALAAVALPAISKIQEKYQALTAAQQAVNSARTPEEYRRALTELRNAEKRITPDEFGLISSARSFKQAWENATASAKHDILSAFTEGLKGARRFIPQLIPIVNDFSQRFRNTIRDSFGFLESPQGASLFQRSAGVLPQLGDDTIRMLGRLSITMAGFSAAATPLATWILGNISERLEDINRQILGGRKIEQWTDALNAAKPLLSAIWAFLTGLGSALNTIGKGAKPLAEVLLRDLADWLNEIADQDISELRAEFMRWHEPLRALGRLVQGLGRGIKDIADTALPFLGPTIDTLNSAILPSIVSTIEKFASVVGPKLPGVIASIANLIDELSQPVANVAGGALDFIKGFIDTLAALPSWAQEGILYSLIGASAISAFFSSPPGKAVLLIFKGMKSLAGKTATLILKHTNLESSFGKIFGKFAERGATPTNPIFVADVSDIPGGKSFLGKYGKTFAKAGGLAAVAAGGAYAGYLAGNYLGDLFTGGRDKRRAGSFANELYGSFLNQDMAGIRNKRSSMGQLGIEKEHLPQDIQSVLAFRGQMAIAVDSALMRMGAFIDKASKLPSTSPQQWTEKLLDLYQIFFRRITQVAERSGTPERFNNRVGGILTDLRAQAGTFMSEYGTTGKLPRAAFGGIFNRPYLGGEAGAEAAVPLTRMTQAGTQALQAALSAYSRGMQRSAAGLPGSVKLTGGGRGQGPAVHIESVVINNAADLEGFITLLENALRKAEVQVPNAPMSEMYAG